MIDPVSDPMVPRPFCIEVAPVNGAVDASFAWGQFDKEVFLGESEAHEN